MRYTELSATPDLYAAESGDGDVYACEPSHEDDDTTGGFTGGSNEAMPGFSMIIATTALAVSVLVLKRRRRP